MDFRMDMLPEEAPPELLSWARQELSSEIGGEYMITRRIRANLEPTMELLMENHTTGPTVWATECTCTACDETWITRKGSTRDSFFVTTGEDGCTYPSDGTPGLWEQEVTTGDSILCPVCGVETEVRAARNLTGGRTKRIQVAELRNIASYTTIIYWMVERRITEFGAFTSARPRYAYVIGGDGRIHGFGHKTGGGCVTERNSRWGKLSSNADRWDTMYSDWGSICNRKRGTACWDNRPALQDMAGTTGEKTGLWKYWEAGYRPITYLQLQRKYHALENLVNAGFVEIVVKICESYEMQHLRWRDLIDPEKQKPNEMLRLSKEDFRGVPKSLTLTELERIQRYRHLGGTAPIQEVMEKLSGAVGDRLLDQMQLFGGSLQKYERYLKKQNLRLKDVQTLADTRRMFQALHPGQKLSEEELWPRRLIQTHDRLNQQQILLIDEKKNADLQAGFDSVVEKFGPIQWTDGGLSVLLPKRNADLILEGNKLNHCVGSYGDQHARGEKIILFIRRARRPERSYYTLNISFAGAEPREIQLHGYGNERHGNHKQYSHSIPRKVRAFVDTWENNVLLPWWREQQKKERTGVTE